MHHRFRILTSLSLALGCGLASKGEDRVRHVVGTPNNEVKVVNTYPEYWVDGKPFIMHAAAFFYHRTPRDRWSEELEHLKALGVNTIDLYPLWNWHQPEENVLDFDGHTNPRRDLKYLLRLLKDMNFKVTCRPGPFFCNEWRNGGYPDWLLRRPEYQMSLQSVLEGRYPLLSVWMYDESDKASAAALANETHLNYSVEWFKQLLGCVEPYLAEHGGNVMHMQIDDDEACFVENYSGPHFWKYMDVLRNAAKEATHHSDLPYYINGSEMRVNAEANDALPEPFWNMGQDYQMGEPGGMSDFMEAAKNKINTETLKTQPLFPPYIIEFGAGFRMKDKDSYETPAHDPSNILMASRVMFQNGLKGLNYFSLNDTLYPTGWEAPWGNCFYSREGAINYLGQEQGRAPYARRNGRLIEGMGALLGAAHPMADAALIYGMGTYSQPDLSREETQYLFRSAKRILWSGAFTHYNFELVDADHNPLENLQRYSHLMLFNPSNCEEEMGKKADHLDRFSERAQMRIQEYLEGGGTLLVFPSLPGGSRFEGVFKALGDLQNVNGDTIVNFANGSSGRIMGSHTVLKTVAPGVDVFARDENGHAIGVRYAFGKGQVVFFGGDFSRWSAPSLKFQRSQKSDLPEETQGQAKAAMLEVMKVLTGAPLAHPESIATVARDPGLYVTELTADSKDSIYGFVGVTNFDGNRETAASLVVRDPKPTQSPVKIRLPRLSLPPRESLMLPLRLPLSHPWLDAGAGLDPADEIHYATAECSRVHYNGKVLAMEFTAPADAEVALRLTGKPSGARLDGREATLQWDAARGLYLLSIAKGEAPHYLRHLDVDYPQASPGITLTTPSEWILGETQDASIRVENPASTNFRGVVRLRADRLQKPVELPVEIPARSRRDLTMKIQIPADHPDGMTAEVDVELVSSGARIAHHSRTITLRSALKVAFDASEAVTFPLREDQRVPILHPMLASVKASGAGHFKIRIENRSQQRERIHLEAKGNDLAFSWTSTDCEIPARQQKTLEFTVKPRKGTATYPFIVTADSPRVNTSESFLLAAIADHESLAYALDYDRDGIQDLVLENGELRCFISPNAGGRSFALVRKATGTNAFNSVGALRDNFLTRIVPADLEGHSEGVAEKRLGLYNRPYALRLLNPAGKQAVAQLSYDAPDIHPKGVRIVRTLRLPGEGGYLLESDELTPESLDGRQAFIRESSFPFRKFMEPNAWQWFTADPSLREYLPKSRQELPLGDRIFGSFHPATGETFAVILGSKAGRWWMDNEVHSTYLCIQFPDFEAPKRVHRYELAYYFGTMSGAELMKQPQDALFTGNKNGG